MKKGKLLLWAPAVVFGLMTWQLVSAGYLGDGQVTASVAVQGLNVQLPAARLKNDQGLDKIAFYKKAEQDSMRMMEKMKREERINGGAWGAGAGGAVGVGGFGGVGGVGGGGSGGMNAGIDMGMGVRGWTARGAVDSNVARVNRKLAELKAALNGRTELGMTGSQGISGLRPGVTGMMGQQSGGGSWRTEREHSPTLLGNREGSMPAADVDRLERLMKALKERSSEDDPEMNQLSKVLDKLIEAQHPRHASIPTQDSVTAAPALPVHPAVAGEAVTGWKPESGGGNRFYDLETSGGEEEPAGTAIEAIIPETQTVVNGAVMRLELATELVIKGQSIPKGTPLYGVVRLNNERLLVAIGSIRYRDRVYPVSLRVVDQDGLAGIYEPGSADRDVVRESVGSGVSGIGAGLGGVSLGAEAASAGIQMARNLAGKKLRLVRVTVKAGYRVFLEDESKGR